MMAPLSAMPEETSIPTRHTMSWHSISVVLKLASLLAYWPGSPAALFACLSVVLVGGMAVVVSRVKAARILFRRRVMRWDLRRLGLRVCLCSAEDADDGDGTVFLYPRDNPRPAVQCSGEFPLFCSTLGTVQCGSESLFVVTSLQLSIS